MSILDHPTTENLGRATAEPVVLPHVEVAGNELTLFEGSMALIDAMVADIRQAKRRVWLESYTIADDAAGQAVSEALVERAAAGVDVRVMYDAIGSHCTPQSYFDRLLAGGVKFMPFIRSATISGGFPSCGSSTGETIANCWRSTIAWPISAA